jgi:hypothetical protein
MSTIFLTTLLKIPANHKNETKIKKGPRNQIQETSQDDRR